MSKVQKHRDALHSPSAWIARSVALFQSAERVWSAAKDSGYLPGSNNPRPDSPLDIVQMFGYYKVAMMLYGMAVETALKAILIRDKSKHIIVQLETDGGGEVQKVSLKNVGDSSGGHDLVQLAENAGIISKNDSEHTDVRKHL